jgi:hypothetical protein
MELKSETLYTCKGPLVMPTVILKLGGMGEYM